MESQITEADGVTPGFAKRHAQAITVAYPDTEREAHASLNEFAALRRRFPVAVIFVVPRREAVR